MNMVPKVLCDYENSLQIKRDYCTVSGFVVIGPRKSSKGIKRLRHKIKSAESYVDVLQ